MEAQHRHLAVGARRACAAPMCSPKKLPSICSPCTHSRLGLQLCSSGHESGNGAGALYTFPVHVSVHNAMRV